MIQLRAWNRPNDFRNIHDTAYWGDPHCISKHKSAFIVVNTYSKSYTISLWRKRRIKYCTYISMSLIFLPINCPTKHVGQHPCINIAAFGHRHNGLICLMASFLLESQSSIICNAQNLFVRHRNVLPQLYIDMLPISYQIILDFFKNLHEWDKISMHNGFG
jgi:hypothetical protein